MRPNPAPGNGSFRSTRHAAPLWLYVLLLFALLAVLAPRGVRADDPPGAGAAVVGDVAGDAPADAGAVERAFESLAARVAPSVVGIRARRRCAVEPAEDRTAGVGEQLVVVNGSGTVIRADGSILTNEHVVRGASAIDVMLHDGSALPATIHAGDARSDLAIVRVARQDLPAAQFCDWSRVARGQWALTLGNPYGLGNDGKLSVAVGVIANLDRRLPGLGEADDRFYGDMIQITAPIVPGNSGGPLFNLRGELTGVVTAMHTRSPDDQGIGFAIPMTPQRRQTIERLLRGESIDYGFIGITVRAATADELRAAGGTTSGVVIESIEADGPAAGAGLRTGDLIQSFDATSIATAAELVERVGRTPIGAQVDVQVRRGAERIAAQLTVEPRRAARVSGLRGGAILWRGLRLANVTREDGERVGSGAGGVVVIDIAPDSPAGRVDLRIGDVIERIADDAVDDINAFRQRVSAEQGVIRVSVRGRGVIQIGPG